jgi:ribosomal protein L35
MPKKNKLKTHKGTKKVLIERKNDVKIGHPGTRHNTGKDSAAASRTGRKASTLSASDARRLKNVQI